MAFGTDSASWEYCGLPSLTDTLYGIDEGMGYGRMVGETAWR